MRFGLDYFLNMSKATISSGEESQYRKLCCWAKLGGGLSGFQAPLGLAGSVVNCPLDFCIQIAASEKDPSRG